MSNLKPILDAVRGGAGKAALATLVKTSGSSYRKAGARFLVRENGSTVGAISGGCLEHDVAEKARSVIRSGTSILAVFDMSGTGDDIWGYGQGCSGVLSILIEPLTDSTIQQFELIHSVHETRKPGVLATVIHVHGELKVGIGSRVFVFPHGTVRETVKNPFVTSALVQQAEQLLDGSSMTKTLTFTEGSLEVFFEVIQPPIALLIAGAGNDAVPVHRLAGDLGWHVTILDHRSGLATKDRFPFADSFIIRPPEEIQGTLNADSRSAAVVMTHQIRLDLMLVPALIRSSFPYVGLLGPKDRTRQLFEHLERSGIHLTTEERSRVHAPVGMNIGAESPEEIAVAVIAEIQAVLSGRPGGFLKDHNGPLHHSPGPF